MRGRHRIWSIRNFTASGSDQLWVSDITYIPTWSGFLFLAVVLDVFSRRVVGWAMANHLRTELVLDALEMALQRRKPKNVIHHSDQGCQYTSIAFGKRYKEAGVRPSMGSVGDCYDNGMREIFTRRSNANCSSSIASKISVKRRWQSASSSKAGTIRTGGIQRSACSHPWSLSGA